MRNGFSLVEMLVVIAVLVFVALILVQIFSGTLRGSSKAQILSAIKQNGQSAIDTMDKIIRTAESLVCPLPTAGSNITTGTTIVVRNRDGSFTRYKFIAPLATSPSANGYIQQDITSAGPTIPTCTDTPAGFQILTDTDKKTGVSIKDGLFSVNRQGNSSIITVEFTAEPGLDFQSTLGSLIDSVKFRTSTTIRLYNL